MILDLFLVVSTLAVAVIATRVARLLTLVESRIEARRDADEVSQRTHDRLRRGLCPDCGHTPADHSEAVGADGKVRRCTRDGCKCETIDELLEALPRTRGGPPLGRSPFVS